MSVTEARLLATIRIAVGGLFLLRTTPLAIAFLPYARFPFLGWPETGWKMSAFGPTLPAWLCIVLCFVRTAAAVSFTIGFRARLFGLVVATSGYILLVNDAMAYTNTLHLIHLSVLVLALADSSVVFAVRPVPAVSEETSVWLVRAVPISVYLFSGLAKLNVQWLSGKTLANLVDQSIVSTPLPAMVLAHARFASIAMAALELALPVLLLVPKSRRAALWIAAAFHAALQLTVHPDIFGMMMIVLLIAFVQKKHDQEPRRPLIHVRSWLFLFLSACTQQPSSPKPLVIEGDDATDAPVHGDLLESAPVDYGPDASNPPHVACDRNSGRDGGECPLPPSTCIDGWLVYYTDGVCMGITCRYQTKFLACLWGCEKGACLDPMPTR